MAGTYNAETAGWELRQKKENQGRGGLESRLYPEVSGELPRGCRQGKDVLDGHLDH